MQRRFPVPAPFARRLNVALCALLLLFIARPAGARDTEFVFGEAACPNPAELQAEVVRLTPQERHQELFERVRVNVADSGDTYRVTLVTPRDRQDKSFTDPARDCAKRARFAAVFIVVTLFPPELDTEEEPKAPPPKTDAAADEPTGEPLEAEPAPVREPEPAPRVASPEPTKPERDALEGPARPFAPIARIELALEGSSAPALGSSVFANKFGPTVLGVLGRGSVLLTLGVGYTFPSRFDAGLVRVRMTELPARAGVRLVSGSGDLSLALDFGISAALRQLRGSEAVAPNEASDVGIGARVDLGMFYNLTERVAVLGGAHATFEPRPSELLALPYGSVGTLPWLWLGARAGFAVAL